MSAGIPREIELENILSELIDLWDSEDEVRMKDSEEVWERARTILADDPSLYLRTEDDE